VLADWKGAAELIATCLPSLWPAGLALLRPANGQIAWPSKEEITQALKEWTRAREALETCWNNLRPEERRRRQA
jgi:hypothetical protein